jgi:IS5 family transposase
MLTDRYQLEDVFARVPELAGQTDPVLAALDRLLDDDGLYQQVRGDLVRRYQWTAVHGRPSTPAEVLLRLLVVQHLYAWSYQETVARVADSLVLRWFVRVYFRRVPDATTLLRWAHTLRPETLHALNDHVAQLARQAKVTRARKLRLDGTCVQTTIHHPTDSGLLGDGVRVLARLIRRARPLLEQELDGVRDAFRSRVRSVRRALQQLHRLRRRQSGSGKGQPAEETVDQQQRALYTRLLTAARQTVRQAQRIQAVLDRRRRPAVVGTTTAAQRGVQRLRAQFARLVPLVERVITQAQTRVLHGRQVPSADKVLSLFEPHTRVVLRHKGGAAVEFGRQVVFDEVEGGIVTRYHVLADGETEHAEAVPAVEHHRQVFGRAPRLVAGDRGVHAKGLEAQLQALGVQQAAIPRSGRLTPEQQAEERSRRWRRRYRWRAGIEGRLHSLRRDYGLRRVRSHGLEGLERDVGWGVVASNLRQIARAHAGRQVQINGRAA